MRDRPLIIAGLLIFLTVATFPVWYNVSARTDPAAPALARPSVAGALLAARQPPRESSITGTSLPTCVEPRDVMRTSHMRLLATWREDVVRRSERTFVASDGRHYEKSLTGTCLACHDRKTEFCDRCHNYAGVSPRCGDCHAAGGASR